MGLGKGTGKRTYVNIKMGKFVTKTREGVVEEYDNLTGNLVGIEFADKEVNSQPYVQLALIVMDGNDTYELQMRYDSGYGRGFCNTIPNADLTKPITFSAAYSEKDGKKISSLFLSQFGKALKWKYTKEHPNGLPPMESAKFKGQTMWDNSAQLRFWKDMIEQEIKPFLIHPAIGVDTHEPEPSQLEQKGFQPISTNEPDDLPF